MTFKDLYDHTLDALTYAHYMQQEQQAEKVYFKHASDHWGTPGLLFQRLDQEFHFTLDAAASEISTKCGDYLTEEIDALQVSWWGRVFCNPPYSKVAAFVEKAIQEVDSGNCEIVVLLVGARVDTQWFWQGSMYAAEVRFLKGRLKFEQYLLVDPAMDYAVNMTGMKLLHAIPLPDGKVLETLELDPAPFPSAVLIVDKTQPQRTVRWWDWKKNDITAYAWEKTIKTIPESTPAEIKSLLEDVNQLATKLEGQYKLSAQKSAQQMAEANAKELLAQAAAGKLDKVVELFKLVGEHPSSFELQLLETWMQQHGVPWETYTKWKQQQDQQTKFKYEMLHKAYKPPPLPFSVSELEALIKQGISPKKLGMMQAASNPKPITKVPEKFFGVATQDLKVGDPVTSESMQIQGVATVGIQLPADPLDPTYQPLIEEIAEMED